MEMARYLKDSATKREDCAQVVVKNKKNALSNPRGVHGANIDREGVMSSPVAASPLTELESSKGIDASIVFVLASAKKARRLGDHTRSEEHTSELQSHSDLVCRLLLEKK